MTDQPPMMHIGQLADRTGLSLRTIRHYDEVGLLPPSGRTSGGFRLYTEADYDSLMVIRRMKPLGFSLDEMARLLRIRAELAGAGDRAARERLRTELDELAGDARAKREKLSDTLARADEFIAVLDDLRGSAGA